MRPNGGVTGAEPLLATASGPQPDTGVAGEVIDSLYRAHALGLIRLALMLVGDQTTAEDVVQDSFLGLFRGWSRLRDPEHALGYLRTSVVNGCRSVQRSRRTRWLRGEPHEGHEGHEGHEPPVWSAEAAAMAGQDQREVLSAVARLPRRQREVLALRYYAGLGDSEIASVLRVSRGTVSSTASRALAALARQLRAEQRTEDQ
jgi:RNA polymerase sigma factor (sigma-70 family)